MSWGGGAGTVFRGRGMAGRVRVHRLGRVRSWCFQPLKVAWAARRGQRAAGAPSSACGTGAGGRGRRGGESIHSQEIPRIHMFISISDRLPVLAVAVPGQSWGLLPSSCSWWPCWLVSWSKENHPGTHCSMVRLRGREAAGVPLTAQRSAFTFLMSPGEEVVCLQYPEPHEEVAGSRSVSGQQSSPLDEHLLWAVDPTLPQRASWQKVNASPRQEAPLFLAPTPSRALTSALDSCSGSFPGFLPLPRFCRSLHLAWS